MTNVEALVERLEGVERNGRRPVLGVTSSASAMTVLCVLILGTCLASGCLRRTVDRPASSMPPQSSYEGISVSIKVKDAAIEIGGLIEVIGTMTTDRTHRVYNAHWDPKKPVPGRLFVYDASGARVLEFYDPRHREGSFTGATKSACKTYEPGTAQELRLRQWLVFGMSAAHPLPPGRYRVQLALNRLLLWEPDDNRPYDEPVPADLDRQMVAYSNAVEIEIVTPNR